MIKLCCEYFSVGWIWPYVVIVSGTDFTTQSLVSNGVVFGAGSAEVCGLTKAAAITSSAFSYWKNLPYWEFLLKVSF